MRPYLNFSHDVNSNKEGVLFWGKEQEIFETLISFQKKRIKKVYSEILPDELPDLINTELHAYLCDVFVPLSDFRLTLNINEINKGIFLYDGELSLLEKNIFKALDYEHRKIIDTECIIRYIETYNRIVVRNKNPVIASICEYYNSNIDNKIYFCDQINLSPLRFLNKSKVSKVLKSKGAYSIREYYKRIYQFKPAEKLRKQSIELEFQSFVNEFISLYKLNERKDIWATNYYEGKFPFEQNKTLTQHQKKLYFSISRSSEKEPNKLKIFCKNEFLNNFIINGQFNDHWEQNLNEIFHLIPNSIEYIEEKIKEVNNHKERTRLASYFKNLVLRYFSRNNKNSSSDNRLFKYLNILTELSLPNRTNVLFLEFVNKSKDSEDLSSNYSTTYKTQPKAYKRTLFLNISFFFDFETIIPFFKIAKDEGLEFEFILGIIQSINFHPVRFIFDKTYRSTMKSDISSLSDYLETNTDIYRYANNFPFLFSGDKLKNSIPLLNDPMSISWYIPLINSNSDIQLINTAISNLDFSIINEDHYKLLYFSKLYKLDSITEFLIQKIPLDGILPEFHAWDKALKLIDEIDYHKNLSFVENEIPYWFIFPN